MQSDGINLWNLKLGFFDRISFTVWNNMKDVRRLVCRNIELFWSIVSGVFFYFFLFYFIFVTFSEEAKFVWIRFLFFLPSFIHFYISSSESFPYLVWFGLVQFGLVWLSFGSFWFGSVWFGLVQFWFSLVKFWSE